MSADRARPAIRGKGVHRRARRLRALPWRAGDDVLALAVLGAVLTALLAYLALLPPTELAFTVDRQPSQVIMHNFYGLERNAGGAFRWSKPDASLIVPVNAPADYRLTLTLQDTPAAQPPRPLTVRVNGRAAGTIVLDGTPREYAFGGRLAPDGPPALVVELQTAPFVPPGDPRPLGVIVARLGLSPAAPPSPWQPALLGPYLLALSIAYAALRLLRAPALAAAGALGLLLAASAAFAVGAREEALLLAYRPIGRPLDAVLAVPPLILVAYALSQVGERLRRRPPARRRWIPSAAGRWVQGGALGNSARAGWFPAVAERGATAGRVARLSAIGASLWLATMTGFYAWTAVHTVRHPFNSGPDLRWAQGWLVLVVAVLCSYRLPARRVVTALWAGGLVTVGLAMIVLSRQLTAALVTLWLLALAWAWADWLLRRLGAAPSSAAEPLEWTAVALPLGLALLSLVGLMLGLAQHLSPGWTWTLLLALTLVQWRPLRRALVQARRLALARPVPTGHQAVPEGGAVVVLLGVVALLNLAGALAPEVQFDALNVHLAVPKIFLAQQRLAEVEPFFIQAYAVHLVDMLFTLSLALHGQIVAKLLTFAMGIIAAVGVYALGCVVAGPRVGLWAAALFYTTPLVAWLSTTTYVDLAPGLFLVAGLLALLRWRDARQTGWLWASGLLVGAALGAKLNTLFGLPAMGLAVLWGLLRARQLSLPARVRGLAGYTLGVGLLAAPWYAVVYAFTGNPFFPLLNGVFKSPLAPPINGSKSAGGFGLGTTPLELLRLPFAFTFESQRFGEMLPPGALGLALVLLPLGVGVVGRRRGAVHLLLATAGVYLGMLAFTFQYGRYYIPILPVVVVLSVAAVAYLSPRGGLGYLNFGSLGIALVAQVAMVPTLFWNIPERVPLRLAFGLETQGEFLARALPAYEAVQYLNGVVEPDQHVVGVGVENLRFYLDAPLASLAVTPDLGPLVSDPAPPKVAANLHRHGYRYLLVDERDPASRLEFPFMTRPFLEQFATLTFSRNGIKLYQLRETATDPFVAANLLSNPGFETLAAARQPTAWEAQGERHVAQSSAQAHTGQVAVLATPASTLTQPVVVEGGRLYTLGHFTRADEPNQSARLQINWLDAQGRQIDAGIELVPAGPEWRWDQMEVIAPTGATTAVIYISVHGASRVWFDDVRFAPSDRHRRSP